MFDKPTQIIDAALLTKDGRVISLPRPARHHNIIRYMASNGYSPTDIAQCEQGFTTNTRPFVGRVLAMQIAREYNQLLDADNKASFLTSEDVW